MPVHFKPEGYHSVTPYIIVNDGPKALEFYKQAFGANELFKMESPDGKIMHAEIRIGDSAVMFSDECLEMGAKSPRTIGDTPSFLLIYVENVDEVTQRAVDAGARILRPVKDQFYGDRTGTLEDPFGHKWTIATHIEDVPPGEMARRAEEAMKNPD